MRLNDTQSSFKSITKLAIGFSSAAKFEQKPSAPAAGMGNCTSPFQQLKNV